VAFASPSLAAEGGDGPPLWEGKVRSARPSPHGLTVELLADGLVLTLRIPPPARPPFPTVGQRVPFRIDPASLQPLGTTDRS
jgi:hypothetical protein